MQNRVTQLFGINYPIIQAGMIWASGWRLASAVSNAGGLGLIGSGSMYPDVLREHIKKCKAATGKPFGVNVPLLYPDIDKHIEIIIEEKVRKPLRQLSTDWRINVKMTDSVTEGKYALCRKALTSLDTWARDVKDNASASAQKQADYERDKAQCKDAIDNPALGNTSPK